MPDLTRRPERASVEAIREHAALAPERAVDGAGEAHAEALSARAQRISRGRLRHQVDVIVLHGEMKETKRGVRCRTERSQNVRKDIDASEGPDAPGTAPREVDRVPLEVRRPRTVWDERADAAAFAAGAGAATAPTLGARKVELTVRSHN